MNVAVMGCGLIASRWIRTLVADPRIEISALIDVDEGAAARLADRLDLTVALAPDLDHALTLVPIDVVANLTPLASHSSTSHAALDAGLHVLSEKPLTLRLDEAESLVLRARTGDRLLAVMQNRGQDPRFLAFRDLLHRASKPPYTVTAEAFVSLHRPGFRSRQPQPATTDLAVHAFDQIRQLVAAPPIRLQCTETMTNFHGTHCSLATICVDFADGSTFSYRGGFTPGTSLRTPAGGRWAAEGSGGGATWDGELAIAGTGRAIGTAEHRAPDAPSGHQACLDSMIEALHDGTRPTCLAADNLGTIALLEAAVTSAQAGHSVAITWPRTGAST
ncbi:Gfo/Idh/MocA family protein [Embleya sp. NPDC059237]|uniref:Gfo/Idh/MocA family protein n=1 Tax=Embleya sp. NPDC059237 TaxID=3346784 RepID=UPI0036C88B4A